nr:uncharacterized protein LOC129271926 [Lytechinus pictus]
MTVSGHKSESSLKHYSRVDEGYKRQMGLCLSEKCQSKDRLSSPSSTRSNGARFGPGPGSGPAKERSGPPCTVSRPPPSPISFHPPPESPPDFMAQPQDLQRSTLGPGPSPVTTTERSASGKPCTISRPPSSPVISHPQFFASDVAAQNQHGSRSALCPGPGLDSQSSPQMNVNKK